MRDQQIPTALGTMPSQTRKHNRSAFSVEHIGVLEHPLPFQHHALRIGFQQGAAYQIVAAIHRAQFVAV